MTPTGAEIAMSYLPPELVDCVLALICPADPRATAPARLDKRQLSRCSLTNRYWASRVRPRMFNRIALFGLHDLNALLDFLGCPSSQLGQLLDELVVAYTADDRPWIHLIYASLMPKLPDSKRASLRVQITVKPSRSVQNQFLDTGLPRRVPHIARLRIYYLSLAWVQVRSLADLVILVRSLPSLETLYCFGLTCTDNGATPRSVPRLARETSNLRVVAVMRCFFSTDALLAFWQPRYVTGPSTSAGTVHRSIHADCAALVCQLLGSLDIAAVPHDVGYWGKKYPYTRFDIIRRDETTDIVYRSISSVQLLFDNTIFVPAMTISLPPTSTQLQHSIVITIDFYVDDRYSISDAGQCDWDLLFSTLLQLGAHVVMVNLGFSSSKDYRRFHDKVISSSARETMSRLEHAGALLCSYWNISLRKWVDVANDRPLATEFTEHFYGALPFKESLDMSDERARFLKLEP